MTDTARSLLKAGKCKSEEYTKGTTYSLFGTIAAFNKMKHDDPDLRFEYVLAGGSAIAFHRNTKIFAWDSDSDIYLIFEENLADEQLVAFYDNLQHEIDAIIGDRTRMAWHPVWDANSTAFHSFWVQAIEEGEGYLDVFILSHDVTKTKLRNRHGSAESLWDWQPNSIISPVQNNQKWAVYNNFEVDIAANTKLLEMNYGVDWMIPDVQQWQSECPNVDDQTVALWIDDIQSRYNTAIDEPRFLLEIPEDDSSLITFACFHLIAMVIVFGLMRGIYQRYIRSTKPSAHRFVAR